MTPSVIARAVKARSNRGHKAALVYYVSILTNKAGTVLCTGMTNSLMHRVYQHREKLTPGFTSRYNVNRLVWYEAFDDVRRAIAREKQIKAGSRQRQLELIRALNPTWRDLYEDVRE